MRGAHALAFLVLVGCSPSPADDAGRGPDAAAPAPPTTLLDVLVVVDTQAHNEAVGEVASASGIVADVLRDLGAGPSPPSLQLAIVSGDMGVGDVTDVGSGCTSSIGDDGLFLGAGGPPPDVACTPPSSGIFEVSGVPGDAFLVDVARCVPVPPGPCSQEQMLEAALKAISPRSPPPWARPNYVPPVFLGGRAGNGFPDGPNAALVRDDSVLVVLIVTPEDDCSTPNPAIWSASDPRYSSAPIRCLVEPDQRYPVARYVDGLLALRRHASRVVFAAYVGIPPADETLSPAEILADPAMANVPYPPMPHALTPACNGVNGVGEPARRIVEVAGGIEAGGGRVVLAPSCGSAFLSFEARLRDTIAAAMAGEP